MIVKWSDDRDLILKTITHKDVYKYVVDDRCPSADNFAIPEFSDEFFCAECHNGDEYLGCFCFVMKSEHEAEIHTCLLPAAKGFGSTLGKMVLDLTAKKGVKLVSTFIPEDNKAALFVALKCGFKFDSEIDPIIKGGQPVKTSRYIFETGDLCQ